VIDVKEVLLRVTSQIKGQKELSGIAKSLEEIASAIDTQTAAAKRGEQSIDSLKASEAALLEVQRGLEDNTRVINAFQRLDGQILKAQERAVAAATAYETYRKKIDETGGATDAQNVKLDSLSAKSERAAQRVALLQKEQGNLAKQLKDSGVATDNFAESEARILDLFARYGNELTKVRGAIRSYGDDVRRARDAERELGAEQALQKKLVDAASLAKAHDYVQFWTEALEAADRAETQAATNRGLLKIANDAKTAATAYSSLARASNNLRPGVQSLRDAVNSLIDPTSKVTGNFASMEKEVEDLTKSVSAINGPVENYRATLSRLEVTQKAIVSQSSLVDNLNSQVVALRAARSEYTTARTEVARYAAAVAQGGEAGQSFVRSLADAQKRASAAASALGQQIGRTREARNAAREAGIATNALADAQERLTRSAKTSTSNVTSLAAAMKKYGKAANDANEANGRGRTTLDLYQRIRGQILSVTAAYVGLFGAIREVNQVIQASNDRQAIRNQLAISVGSDRDAIDAEYAYIKGQSDRIGLEFDRTARGYAKFAASATLAGRARQEIRYIFETFAEVGRVANLSTDDLDGVLKALEQIMSKGSIQAEELRGQLGDRLFGAFQVAAKALEDQFPNLSKALEQGQVSANNLLLIAEKYRSMVGDQLPSAVTSLVAQQARLNNSLFEFRLAVGDSGFLDSFTEAIVLLTNFFKSDDGKKFANELGNAFKAFTDTLIVALKNLEAVKTVLVAIAAIAGALFLRRLGKDLLGMAADVRTSYTRIAAYLAGLLERVQTLARVFPVAAKLIVRFLGVIGLAIAAWQLGSWIMEKFDDVKTALTYFKTWLDEAILWITGGVELASTAIATMIVNAFKFLYNSVANVLKRILTVLASFAFAVGATPMGNALKTIADSLEVSYESIYDATKTARERMEKELREIRRVRAEALGMSEDMSRTATQADVRRIDNQIALSNPTAIPPFVPTTPQGASDADLEKKRRAVEDIRRSLEALEAKINRSQTDSLDAQLKAIDLQYLTLGRRIDRFGKLFGRAEAVEFATQLTALTNELRAVTIERFNKDLADQTEQMLDRVESVESAAGKKQLNNLEVRQAAIRKQYESYFRELNALWITFIDNGLDTTPLIAMHARLEAAVGELQKAEALNDSRNELENREKRLNQILAVRTAQIEVINAKRETGAINDVEAAKEINRINRESIPVIQDAYEATRQWAIVHKEVFANEEDFQLFMANLEAIRLKAQQVKTEFTEMQLIVGSLGAGAINEGLGSVYDNLQKVYQGQMSMREGWNAIGEAFQEFAAQFLRDLAIMMARLAIFRAMQNSGNPWLAAVGNAGAAGSGGGNAQVKHSGGIVGGTSNRTRALNFNPSNYTIPRYHSGGLPGINSSEVLTILEKGEEVLDKESPRNALNGGLQNMMQGGSASGSKSQRIVLVDDRSKIPEAMAGAEGDQVIIQSVRRNLPTFKQLLGG